MEGETVAIALAGAVAAAYLIVRFGSRQPAEHRPLPDSARTSPDAVAAPSDDVREATESRRGIAARIPRQRRESDAERQARMRRLRAARDAARTPIDADLLRTLEELARHPQNRAAAVNLLRQRTGMSSRHARRFINAL
jgi:hypothetical protein